MQIDRYGKESQIYIKCYKLVERLKKIYYQKLGKALNLSTPLTYNEKIQWSKLYDKDIRRTLYSDKLEVRKFVREKIGEEYLIPILGIWDDFLDINFNELPNKFVLKTNHGCGFNEIVTDKQQINIFKIMNKFKKWMEINFAFKEGLELQYKNITPKIFAEQYLENNNSDIYDYKVFCFNGKPTYIMFLSERKKRLKMKFFDTKWNELPMVYSYLRNDSTIKKPECLEELLRISEILSKDFNHVRCDFYITNDNKIKFGEMTFTSASGYCKWNDDKYDKLLGDFFKIEGSI